MSQLVTLSNLVQEADLQDRSKYNHFYTYQNNLTKNLVLYCRNGLILFYAFFEVFVNSIGYDYQQKHNRNLTSSEINLLKVYKSNGGFLFLEKKICSFQNYLKRITCTTIFEKCK